MADKKSNKLWDLRATLRNDDCTIHNTIAVPHGACLESSNESNPHNASLFTYHCFSLKQRLIQVLIQSALSKFKTSILISTSALAVNSFLIAGKVNELDTKQSVSVSETSFTQQYPANLSEMLIRGPILGAYTALIK